MSQKEAGLSQDSNNNLECIATEIKVLVPTWETKYVTLCADVLTIHKDGEKIIPIILK